MNLRLLPLALLFIFQMNGQQNYKAPPTTVASAYNFSLGSGTYTEITGGTVLGSLSSDNEVFVNPANLAGTTVDLSAGPGFPIGFNFTFNGDIFDRVAVCTNGWISLGKSAFGASAVIGQISPSPINQFADGPDAGTKSDFTPNEELRYRIAGMACNLVTQSNSEMRIETIGTAPNRKLIVQWKNFMPSSASTDASGHNYNFQIQLLETTNIVQVVFGGITFGSNAFSSQIGLGGLDETDYHNRWVSSAVSSTSTWAAPDAGFVNTSACDMRSTMTVPAVGSRYIWSSVTLERNSFVFKDLKIFPNAVVDHLKISNNKIISSIVIYDVLGNEVYNKKLDSLEDDLLLSHLASGQYFIKIMAENQSKTLKIIKK
jgi:Secretion system C-terminal sorting domain